MVSAKIIETGEAIETMVNLEGWKHVNGWIEDREKEYINKLKTAGNFKEIIENQAYLRMIDRLKAHIRNSIENKNKELQNQVKNRS